MEKRGLLFIILISICLAGIVMAGTYENCDTYGTCKPAGSPRDNVTYSTNSTYSAECGNAQTLQTYTALQVANLFTSPFLINWTQIAQGLFAPINYNPFNQVLNTTSNVNFNKMSANDINIQNNSLMLDNNLYFGDVVSVGRMGGAVIEAPNTNGNFQLAYNFVTAGSGIGGDSGDGTSGVCYDDGVGGIRDAGDNTLIATINYTTGYVTNVNSAITITDYNYNIDDIPRNFYVNGDGYFQGSGFFGGDLTIGGTVSLAGLNVGYITGLGDNSANLVSKGVSDNARNTYNTVRTTTSATYVRVKRIIIYYGITGNIRVKFNMKSSDGTTAYARIYTGPMDATSPRGSEFSTTSTTYVEKTVDLGCTANDLTGSFVSVDVWGKIAGGKTVSIENFSLSYDDAPLVAVYANGAP